MYIVLTLEGILSCCYSKVASLHTKPCCLMVDRILTDDRKWKIYSLGEYIWKRKQEKKKVEKEDMTYIYPPPPCTVWSRTWTWVGNLPHKKNPRFFVVSTTKRYSADCELFWLYPVCGNPCRIFYLLIPEIYKQEVNILSRGPCK